MRRFVVLVGVLGACWFTGGLASAGAQEVTIPTQTTQAPTTVAPTQPTQPPTTAAPTTAAPATTAVPTTRRTTTTIPPTTTTPDQIPTLPTEQTVPPAPGATTVDTTDLNAIQLDARVSPIFPALSIGGFVTAALIVATQWFLTRRPNRATL